MEGKTQNRKKVLEGPNLLIRKQKVRDTGVRGLLRELESEKVKWTLVRDIQL